MVTVWAGLGYALDDSPAGFPIEPKVVIHHMMYTHYILHAAYRKELGH